MEASYAYYALNKLHILPSEFCKMSKREQLFIVACIDKRIESEKRQIEKSKSHSKRG